MAQLGHGAMSELSPLSGVKRKSGLRAVRSVVDAVDGSSTGYIGAMDVGAVEAPTIQRSEPCRR